MRRLGLRFRLNLGDAMTPRIAAVISVDGANTVPQVLGSFVVGNVDTDYHIEGVAYVTSLSSGQFAVKVGYTDEAGQAADLYLTILSQAGANNDPMRASIRAKANTTVTFNMIDNFVGSAMTVNVRIYPVQLSNL